MAQGSIAKYVAKNGTVRYRVRIDAGIDPITGRRKRPLRSFKTRREAEAAMARWLDEVERGTAVDHRKMSVGEYLAHWLEADVRPNVRPSTYSGYERLIRVQLTPRIGAVPLQRLNALHINLAF